MIALHKRVVAGLKYKRHKNPEFLKALITQGVHKDLFWVLSGLAGVMLGAKYLVIEAIFFADQVFHVPETVIAVSLIAFGTSVPELGVSITAARKGYGNIAVLDIDLKMGKEVESLFWE